MESYLPNSDAERDHLEKYFENISMNGDEDPKLFFARAEGKLNVLSSLGIHTPDREVVRMLAHRLPSEVYDVEQRTTVVFYGSTSRARRWKKSSALITLTARPRRCRSES